MGFIRFLVDNHLYRFYFTVSVFVLRVTSLTEDMHPLPLYLQISATLL